MNTRQRTALCAAAFLLGLAPTVQAAVVLTGRTHCYQVLGNPPGAWSQTFKIEVGRAVTDRSGSVSRVTGLERGFKAVYPPLYYFNGLAGAAFYVPAEDQELSDVVQVTLTGNSYGTDTGASDGIRGLWTLNYSMLLNPARRGLSEGKVIFSKSFKPLGPGHEQDPVVSSYEVKDVEGLRCRDAAR